MTAKIDLIILFLKENPGASFKTKEIAAALLSRFPDEFKTKVENPRFKSNDDIINQISAEIGSNKQHQFDKRKSGVIVNNDKPRTFCYMPEGKSVDNVGIIDIIADTLKSSPGTPFERRTLAKAVYKTIPERYQNKLSDPNFGDPEKIVSFIASGIVKETRARLLKKYPQIKEHDTSPITLSWNPSFSEVTQDFSAEQSEDWDGKEESLYPIFNKYLHEHHKLYPMRIDEKRSKNQRGKGGNEWLYPDIVALHPMDKEWSSNIRQCANLSYGEVINLWSFEVKKALTTGNVRKCYFQAVSNSSWANYGYLVATNIEGEDVLSELKMLHALHGIGVMLMNPSEPEMTKTILPAEKRDKIDWISANRLAEENRDFMEFTANTSDYLQTKRLKSRDWHM